MGPAGSFDYRAADLVAVNTALYGELYPFKVRAVLLASTLGLILAGAYLGLGLGWLLHLDLTWTVLLGLVGLLLGTTAVRPVGMRASRWAVRRLESSKSREGLTVQFELREDALRISSQTGESIQRWEGVHKVMEKGGSLIFIVGAGAHFIPLRSFASAADRKAAIDWIHGHLPADARARSTLRAAS